MDLLMCQSSLLKTEIISVERCTFPVNGLTTKFSISSMLNTLMVVPITKKVLLPHNHTNTSHG
jgi:hypothetical protein